MSSRCQMESIHGIKNIHQKQVVPWKYNIRRNVNADFSIVTMRRVAIIFFELGVVKNLMQKF